VLEPCAGKLARTVLRGERRSNPPDLPDFIASKSSQRRLAETVLFHEEKK